MVRLTVPVGKIWYIYIIIFVVLAASAGGIAQSQKVSSSVKFQSILGRIRVHNFEDNSGGKGVGDLNDVAWRVRMLAIRDFVRVGSKAVPSLKAGLRDENRHVRHVCVMALGILGIEDAGEDLLRLLTEDPDPIVRGQAAQALGQIGYKRAEPILKKISEEGEDRNIRHRAKLALERLKLGARSGPGDIEAWAGLDEKKFRLAKVGKPAPDFELKDTNDKVWQLSDYKGKKTVVLIWIFADWCPVCHREFHDLIEMEKRFKQADVQVFTIECHDMYRTKVMAEGRGIWGPFLKEWGPKRLAAIEEKVLARRKLWWPHLADIAGTVGAMYGVDPMEFTVHDEWINRPSTIIVDKEGVVRFTYYGTYWGDRPTIEETLEMIKTNTYKFVHPNRIK